MSRKTHLLEIYSRILARVRTSFGKYGIFYILAQILGTATYYFIQEYRLGYVIARENLIDGVILLVAVNVVLFMLLVPYIRFWVIPEEIYQDQESIILQKTEEISNLVTSDERKPLNLNVSWGNNIAVDVGGGIPRVTLKLDVINNEKRKILDLEAYLVRVDQITEELPPDWTFTNSFSYFRMSRLEWKDKNYKIDLTPGFPESFVQIVSLDCSISEVRFIHEGISRRISELQVDAIYKIIVEFKGKIEGENPDYRFFRYTTFFACSPANSQIGNLMRENSNPAFPNWLRERVKLTLKNYKSLKDGL